MNFIVFKSSTGEVLWSGSCLESDYQHQVTPEGCTIIEGVARPGVDYVESGGIFEIPASPGEFYSFDWAEKRWVEDPDIFVHTELMYRIRSQRDGLLAKSDWTDTYSAPARLGVARYQLWQAYRQALRDITENLLDPENVVWPVAPE